MPLIADLGCFFDELYGFAEMWKSMLVKALVCMIRCKLVANEFCVNPGLASCRENLGAPILDGRAMVGRRESYLEILRSPSGPFSHPFLQYGLGRMARHLQSGQFAGVRPVGKCCSSRVLPATLLGPISWGIRCVLAISQDHWKGGLGSCMGPCYEGILLLHPGA